MIHEIRDLYNLAAKIYLRHFEPYEVEKERILPPLERMVHDIVTVYIDNTHRRFNQKSDGAIGECDITQSRGLSGGHKPPTPYTLSQ